ncbi:hypothetical protein BpHYR1_001864 [Brachionus plicatilis]|uniref:Secreted protein n=1 Tax=Brachionus plicatilis TaxID=10195 RepID=A0A3M7PT42_BRAPC|nr:hypothetical protein BpHYR1_001864 [Brachionus plicatilis]
MVRKCIFLCLITVNVCKVPQVLKLFGTLVCDWVLRCITQIKHNKRFTFHGEKSTLDFTNCLSNFIIEKKIDWIGRLFDQFSPQKR